MAEYENKKAKIVNHIDKYLSQEHLEKLCFLTETVLPLRKVQKADCLPDLLHGLESNTVADDNACIKILKRFLDTIGFIKFGKQLDSLISPADTYIFPSLDKLYLYELAILVCDNLDTLSFKRLKNRIPDIQLGGNRDRITTPIQLFRRLIHENTLNFLEEKKSLDLLKEWLGDIGRKDIVQLLNCHPRPVQEQGMSGRQAKFHAVYYSELSTLYQLCCKIC